MVKARYETAASLGHVAHAYDCRVDFPIWEKRNPGTWASSKPESAFLAPNLLYVSNIIGQARLKSYVYKYKYICINKYKFLFVFCICTYVCI